MEDSKDKFYFEGKYFDNQDDFWKYVNEWQHLDLDEEIAERKLNFLKIELMTNIYLHIGNFKNNEFNNFIRKVFEFAIIEMDKQCQEKE